MHDLQTILATLRTKAHCILPIYASSLKARIEKYLAGEFEIEEKKEDEKQEEAATLTNGIAKINIDGVIMKRVGLPKEILDFFGIVDLDHVDAQLIEAKSNPSVSSILLTVNSPGGFITGVASTAMLIDEITKTKEVTVYSDVLNASAAYWLSSQANTIVTSVDAEIGSIGVYTTFLDTTKYYEDKGFKVEVFKAGKYKAMGVNGSLNDEQRAFIQAEIDASYAQFTGAVTSKRTVAVEDMQGQTFSGLQAVEKGLVDAVASPEEILAALSDSQE